MYKFMTKIPDDIPPVSRIPKMEKEYLDLRRRRPPVKKSGSVETTEVSGVVVHLSDEARAILDQQGGIEESDSNEE